MRAVRPAARAWVAGGLVLCGLLAFCGSDAERRDPPPLGSVVVTDLGPG